MTRLITTLSFLFLIVVQVASAQQFDWESALPEMEESVERAMIEGRIPSLTIALVIGDEMVWSEGYGYANLWSKTPAVPSTVYLIGSTFKTMSTAALLRFMDAGSFSLDDKVSDYLHFLKIRNEDPEAPITFKHLLTHTSGLPGAFGPYPVWGDEMPPTIDDYLAATLRTEAAPESRLVYSNMAYTLIGYMIQHFADEPFKVHIEKEIFTPLEMTSTGFSPSPVMAERLAMPYVLDAELDQHVPTEWLNASVWPAGIVYGTVKDQANWLIANLNSGVFKGRHIIEEETLDIMHSLQLEKFKGKISGLWGGDEAGYGLTWWTDVRKGERIFAHSGSVPGYTAFLQGNKDQKIGVAILSNGNKAHPHLVKLTDKIMNLVRENAIVEIQETELIGN